jgi:hydrogenase maturation protease
MFENRKTAVVGIGNVLMSDDAFGPYIIKQLDATYRFPPIVSLVEAGTPGLDLSSVFYGFDVLIVVDTVRAQGNPGDLGRYERDELLKKVPSLAVSPHDPGLKEALLTLQIAQEGPREVVLIGVIPENVDVGLGLSAPVTRAIPRCIEAIITELKRVGIEAEKKSPPDELDIWWK